MTSLEREWLDRGSVFETRARPAALAAPTAMRLATHSRPVPIARTATLPINDGGIPLDSTGRERSWMAGRLTVICRPQRLQKLSCGSRVAPQPAHSGTAMARGL